MPLSRELQTLAGLLLWSEEDCKRTGDDQISSVSERRVEQTTDSVACLLCNLLGRLDDPCRNGNDGQRGGENDCGSGGLAKVLDGSVIGTKANNQFIGLRRNEIAPHGAVCKSCSL